MPRQIPIAFTARTAPAPVSSYRRPTPPPMLPTPSARQTYQRQLIESATPAEFAQAPSAFFWATLTADANIGGHVFQAGTRVVVQPSVTTTMATGKAHVTVQAVRAWAKFGQTFDASSWVSGWLATSLFQPTGQSASWSNQVGFGATPTGLALTPSELAALDQQIKEASTVAANRAAEAALQKTRTSIYIAVGVAAVMAGVFGGLLGASLAKR